MNANNMRANYAGMMVDEEGKNGDREETTGLI